MESERATLSFEEWVSYGIEHGYCSPGVCAMHDGLPMTAEEEREADEGGDPCLPALRCFPYGDRPDDLVVPSHAFGV